MINKLLCKQITENLPFSPNSDQQEAIIKMADFLVSGGEDSVFLLRGFAGTGKTSLVSALVKALTLFEQKCVLLAPTGRAAKVFSLYAEKEAWTIHRKIYRQRRYFPTGEGFLLGDNLFQHTLFLVDEASMISNGLQGDVVFGSGHLLDDLVTYVYGGQGNRLLLIGDQAQLPPVGLSQSDALCADTLRGYGLAVFGAELKEVARQRYESGILHNASLLRENMFLDPSIIPALHLKSFSDIKVVGGVDLTDEIESAYNQVGMEDTIIITRSNKRATQFNLGIRNRILYREEEISSGDQLMVSKNNYFWSEQYTEIDFIANGDLAIVKKVRRQEELYGFRFADVVLYFSDYDFEIEVKIFLDNLTSDTPTFSHQDQERLFLAVMSDYSDLTSKSEQFKRLKSDPYFNALQVKYGYAVTCHKAQGGEWKRVFIDLGTINKEMIGLDFYRWLYTALTRSKEQLYLINPDPVFIAED